MPRRHFPSHLAFPDPNLADADGIVAYGGDVQPQRLLAAYAQGIFPWPYREDWPMLWFSPDPRMVLLPEALHISRSLQKTLKRGTFDVRCDTAFARVMQACARTPRPGQQGTWITAPLLKAYGQLHALGFAHSIEAWADDELVGGLYGVSLGAAFFGESMFAWCPDASKVAFVHLVQHLQAWGFHFIDCQVHTDHMAHFGAVMWSRRRFLGALKEALQLPTRQGAWCLGEASTARRTSLPRL